MDFTHVHSSGRFDRPIEGLRKEVLDHRKRGELVTRTENSARPDSVFRGPGWSFVHLDGKGHSECSAEWRNDTFALHGNPRAVQITDRTWTRSREYGGQKAAYVHALYVPLAYGPKQERLLNLLVVHMPLDNMPLRADIWVECCEGLVELVRESRKKNPGSKTLIAADWNKNFRQENEQGMIRRHVAEPLGMTQAWVGEADETKGGTHGPLALIDGDVSDIKSNQRGEARLLKDTKASDHRPYAVDY